MTSHFCISCVLYSFKSLVPTLTIKSQIGAQVNYGNTTYEQKPLYKLAESTRDHLRKMKFENYEDSNLAHVFANDLDSILFSKLPERRFKKRSVSGLRHTPDVLGSNVSGNLSGLFEAARNAFDHVRWTEFYEKDSWSRSFLDEFTNGEGIGPDGALYHPRIILG